MRAQWWAATRAALRIARRDAQRHKARSVLVIAMVALPIVGVTTADLLTHSQSLTPLEQTYRDFGDADALVVYRSAPVAQAPDGQFTSVSSPVSSSVSSRAGQPAGPDDGHPVTGDQLRALLPAGANVTSWGTYIPIEIRHGDGAPVSVYDGEELDRTSPATKGLFLQRAGRAASAPGEIDLSAQVARQLKVDVGDTVTARSIDSTAAPRAFAVVGIVQRRFAPNAMVAVAAPGALPSGVARAGFDGGQFLVTSPTPLTWNDVLALNARGATMVARSVVENPPPKSQVPYYRDALNPPPGLSTTTKATIAVVVAMCLLEIVFLAGPAFAVGARAQRRQLGLVIASGGEPRHAGAVVLGGGVVLGLVGGVVGVGLGLAAGLAIRHHLIVDGHDFGGLHLHGWEIAGAGAIGLVVGTLAAAWPARVAARQSAVEALAGRRPAARSPKRISIVGLLAVAFGVALTIYGAVRRPTSADVAYGSAIAELGLAACTPALIGLAARFAHRAPLASRLALRDNGRNRGRAAPAVAAIMAAVAGSVAIGIYTSSDHAAQAQAYRPTLLSGQAALYVGANDAQDATRLADAALPALPAHDAVLMKTYSVACAVGDTCSVVDAARAPGQECPAVSPDATPAELRDRNSDPRCAGGPYGPSFGDVLVGGPGVLRALVGHDNPAADATLAAGGAVAFDQRFIGDGKLTVNVASIHPSATQPSTGSGPVTDTQSFPATFVAAHTGTQVLLSPAAAARLGAAPSVVAVVFDTSRMPTHAEEAKADKLLAEAGSSLTLYVERGYRGHISLQLLFLIIGAAIVTIGAAGVTTGLAIADAKPDHATLAAVGASPATRRRLAMASAGTVALIGAVLGAASGFVPAFGILRAHESQLHPFSGGYPGSGVGFIQVVGPNVVYSVPWLLIGAVVVGVPIVAALCAGAFTRSQRVLERRVL